MTGRRGERDGGSLRDAIDAERRSIDSARAGHVGYYVDATTPGRPLLLVHSLNAAPSAMEMRPLFEHYRRERPVVALDLPGFGISQRGDRDYTPELLSEAIVEVAAASFDGPADVVALSLGSELAARAVLASPDRWRSLCLISPTGFARRRPPGESVTRAAEAVFGLGLLAEPLFRALTSEASIRFFLDRNFEGRASETMIEYAIETARIPGARYAPFRFLSGRLFTRDAFERLYAPLELPTLVLYDRDPNVSFERLPDWLAARDGRSARRIAPTLGLPHWEELEQCVDALASLWKELDASGA